MIREDFRVEPADWATDLPDLRAVREEVFIVEQRIPEAEEWDALGPDEKGRGEAVHPQFHLKLLLDRIGVHRDEVQRWRWAGRAASPPARSRAVANAMAAPAFSHKWETLRPAERRLSGIRVAELPDAAAEAQAIALALREALETPGKTAAQWRKDLWDRRIEAPVIERPERLLIRVSHHFYTTEAEIDVLAGFLGEPAV